jgi:hypothetical protein
LKVELGDGPGFAGADVFQIKRTDKVIIAPNVFAHQMDLLFSIQGNCTVKTVTRNKFVNIWINLVNVIELRSFLGPIFVA